MEFVERLESQDVNRKYDYSCSGSSGPAAVSKQSACEKNPAESEY